MKRRKRMRMSLSPKMPDPRAARSDARTARLQTARDGPLPARGPSGASRRAANSTARRFTREASYELQPFRK
jgi:hypothetical protein